jgi:hypothetical protein
MGAASTSTFEVGHTFDEIEQCGAHRAVLECPPHFHERMELFVAELLSQRLKLGIALGRVDELQKRHLKESRKADETVKRNAVLTIFIFLDLLERHVEKLGDLALALAGGAARGADIAPQITVEGAFGQASFMSSGQRRESLVSYRNDLRAAAAAGQSENTNATDGL